MVQTTSSTPPPEPARDALSEHDLQLLWNRAKHVDTIRTVLLVISSMLFVLAMGLLDLHHWRPQLHRPVSDALPWAIGFALLTAVLIGITAWTQRHSDAKDNLSPLLGLPTSQRRKATKDLYNARPSADPVLREVEILRARQVFAKAACSTRTLLVTPVVQAAVAVLFLTTDSSALGVFWALLACLSTVTVYRTKRGERAAGEFLMHCGELPEPLH